MGASRPSEQPPSFRHRCDLLAAASGGRLSARSQQPVPGATGVHLAGQTCASCGEAGTALSAERILL